MILAIDPGTTESAYVWFRKGQIYAFGKVPNADILTAIDKWRLDQFEHGTASLVVEMIASYGMPVGREVFDTCRWIGRFEERWGDRPFATLYRSTVKLHLCGQTRAKDANVRQTLIDRFGPGKDRAIGTKAKPGPLYGVKADVWQALALAVTYADGVGS